MRLCKWLTTKLRHVEPHAYGCLTRCCPPAPAVLVLSGQPRNGTLTLQVMGVVKLGLVVLATFAVCWAPFLATPGGAAQVLHRLVPVKRGLYEDYVANFWCVTSPVFKWRRTYTQQVCVLGCSPAG